MLCAPGVIKGVSIVRNKDSGFWARFLQTLGEFGERGGFVERPNSGKIRP